jgi:hypothetical protein
MGMKLPNVGEQRRPATDRIPVVDCKFGQKRTPANTPNQTTEPRVGGSNPSSRTEHIFNQGLDKGGS